MSRLRTLFLTIVGLVALVATSLADAPLETLTFQTADGPRAFQVEVSDTPEKREVGLMYRRSLAADRGMLFDFERPQAIAMWMKNTYVSLDMVFVSATGEVKRIAENTEPLSTRTISSGGPVRYVVELPAGTAKRIGLKPGDGVAHRRIKD